MIPNKIKPERRSFFAIRMMESFLQSGVGGPASDQSDRARTIYEKSETTNPFEQSKFSQMNVTWRGLINKLLMLKNTEEMIYH
jgi:hypothetical protein